MPFQAKVAVRPVVERHPISTPLFIPIFCSAVLVFGLGQSRAQQNSAATPRQSAPSGAVLRVTIAPEQVTLMPGNHEYFSAIVNGTGSYGDGVAWSVNDVEGGNSGLGTISKTGLYVTPFPAPQSVTITAKSISDPTKRASAVVTFAAPPIAEGPKLTVDAGTAGHAISPLIYGMNSYRQSDPNQEALKVAKAVRLTVNRWGGDGVTRYNYKLDISNHGDHWFYENVPNSNALYPDVSEFNSQVIGDRTSGTKTMGTVPVMGWVAKSRTFAGSFAVAKYGPQEKTDPYWKKFGNGVKPDGTKITNNDPTDTCMQVDASWSGDWVKYLVSKFGDAAHGGVAIYSLDNEPGWWDLNHRDVHPQPFTYDEVTENGIKVARAVKAADPTAEISGPVLDYWYTYFYSKKDLASIKGTWPNLTYDLSDRISHGNLPFVEYYLKTFKAAQDADPNHMRLLDYLDLHTYFVAGDAGLNPASTSEQQRAVLNSTRVFWDPTYSDERLRDPNNFARTIPPMIIRRMKQWVAKDYPGTKTAITEYNWGGEEHISGAVAQADILGIFGREGLDMGELWGPPDLNSPAMFAFKIFRNYDDAGGEFGDRSIDATSSDQGQIAVYAALRTADNKMTVVVINKTFGDLKSDLIVSHLNAAKRASVFQYSDADLKRIRTLPDTEITRLSKKDHASGLKGQVFPAMSITLYVVSMK